MNATWPPRMTAGDYWEVVLLSILFCLLGLDMLRIVRLLLGASGVAPQQ